jgi:hypothetical protein
MPSTGITKGVRVMTTIEFGKIPYAELDSKNLLSLVRDTRTLEGRVSLYQNADISIKTFDPSYLYPTAKYVLKPNLRFVTEMRDTLLAVHKVDIFKLNEVFIDEQYMVAPPVIEISDGLPAIVDGIHRCELARRLGLPITVILVDKVEPTLPIISYPVTWQQVAEYEVKPENPCLLRNIRSGIADDSGSLRKYYRDFGYLGSSGRRPREGQSS